MCVLIYITVYMSRLQRNIRFYVKKKKKECELNIGDRERVFFFKSSGFHLTPHQERYEKRFITREQWAHLILALRWLNALHVAFLRVVFVWKSGLGIGNRRVNSMSFFDRPRLRNIYF